MILKFVLYPTKEGEAVQEVVVECSGFNQSYVDQGDHEPKDTRFKAHFDIRGNTDTGSMEVCCENTAIYVMNDNGRTIDSYRWKKTPDNLIKRM